MAYEKFVTTRRVYARRRSGRVVVVEDGHAGGASSRFGGAGDGRHACEGRRNRVAGRPVVPPPTDRQGAQGCSRSWVADLLEDIMASAEYRKAMARYIFVEARADGRTATSGVVQRPESVDSPRAVVGGAAYVAVGRFALVEPGVASSSGSPLVLEGRRGWGQDRGLTNRLAAGAENRLFASSDTRASTSACPLRVVELPAAADSRFRDPRGEQEPLERTRAARLFTAQFLIKRPAMRALRHAAGRSAPSYLSTRNRSRGRGVRKASLENLMSTSRSRFRAGNVKASEPRSSSSIGIAREEKVHDALKARACILDPVPGFEEGSTASS